MDSETEKGRRDGGRAYRSRLESFAEFIREQRQQRKTWQEIATRLGTEKNCLITFQGVHQFYRRWLKRQARSHWEDESFAAQPAATKSAVRPPTLAAMPQPRSFRQPNPEHIQLNDPTKL